jgi:hypothetical protein
MPIHVAQSVVELALYSIELAHLHAMLLFDIATNARAYVASAYRP